MKYRHRIFNFATYTLKEKSLVKKQVFFVFFVFFSPGMVYSPEGLITQNMSIFEIFNETNISVFPLKYEICRRPLFQLLKSSNEIHIRYG